MANKKIIASSETLDLFKFSAPKGRTEVTKVFPTSKHVFITYSNLVAVKTLCPAEDEVLGLPVEHPVVIQKHPTPVMCLGTSENELLVCACSEAEVILSKWDSMLKNFDIHKIGIDLGRILSCVVSVKDEIIYVSLAKFNELMVIRCTGSNPNMTEGPLDLICIEIIATSERISETCAWLQNLWLDDTLYIFSISAGNAVSLKLWEVTQDKQVKLKDHRMTVQSKTFAGADLSLHDNHNLLIVISPEGLAEVFTVTSAGFGLLTRIKVDESALTYDSSAEDALSKEDVTGYQIEFKILAVRHFQFHEIPKPNAKEADESAEFPEIPDLNNTLACGDGKSSWEYPKLLVAIASTKGLSLFNVRSGESELFVKYGDILNSNNSVISNAKLHVNHGTNQICCIFQPLLNKCAHSVCINVEPMSPKESACSLTSINPVSSKSVLRKKLKSPPPAPKKLGMSMSNLTLHPHRFRVSMDSGPAWSLNGATVSKLKPKAGVKNSGNEKNNVKIDTMCETSRPSSGESGSYRIQSKGNYGDDELRFLDSQGVGLKTRLSDTMTYLRMAFSLDGKILVAGGNDSPLVIYKTGPIFENIKVHKDPRRITALDFPISSNCCNLLLASNDGKTEIMNWKTGSEILSFKFTSKFTEHVHTQYYYMDNFILQPEDNRLVLYSLRGALFLKAGTFPMTFQKITAVAAPNKFYSSSILCAGSNKSIQLFDAGSEKASLTIPNAHTKSITAIRINEAPKASHATSLCDIFLTCTNSVTDPIKLWDLRSAKCITRIADLNAKTFVPSSRPGLSPCGRYIASGFEANTIAIYDIRKINSRVSSLKCVQSQILDLEFDQNSPMLWCGTRNGKLWNFTI